MKIKELLEKIEELVGKYSVNSDQDFMLHGDTLKLFLPKINEADEFKNCKLIQLFEPNPLYTQGRRHSEDKLIRNTDPTITENYYIYSIGFSPKIYRPDTTIDYLSIKYGCGITPYMYDPENSQPYRIFKIKCDVNDDPHKILDIMLENKNDYTPKTEKEVIIRGLFESQI
jgi:hypothetical protein